MAHYTNRECNDTTGQQRMWWRQRPIEKVMVQQAKWVCSSLNLNNIECSESTFIFCRFICYQIIMRANYFDSKSSPAQKGWECLLRPRDLTDYSLPLYIQAYADPAMPCSNPIHQSREISRNGKIVTWINISGHRRADVGADDNAAAFMEFLPF